MVLDSMVTVIIPNFNHAKFLDKRIQSVLDQTYLNFEVIILDDASTDESLKIIEKYKDESKIKEILINTKNSGSVFKQWRKGINLATEKYLWIAESDDFAEKRFLECAVNLLEKNKEAGLIFTDSYNIDENDSLNGKISDRHSLLDGIGEPYFIFDNSTKAPRYFIEDMLILNASAVLFDLEKFREAVDLEKLKSFKNTGDQFVYLSIFLKNKMIYLNQALNYRRIHGSNTTALNFANGVIYRERIEIINYFFPIIKKLPGSKNSFNNYLRQNFLKTTDFQYFQALNLLLKKIYSSGNLNFKKYQYLKLYILLAKAFPKNVPYRYRRRIKEILQE